MKRSPYTMRGEISPASRPTSTVGRQERRAYGLRRTQDGLAGRLVTLKTGPDEELGALGRGRPKQLAVPVHRAFRNVTGDPVDTMPGHIVHFVT